jgi:hypothetical protein
MTVTLDIPEPVEQAYRAEARRKGVSLDELVRDVVLSARPIASDPMELPPKEWTRQFKAWVSSHERLDLPVLSDEAMSRDSIYDDRGA